MARQPLGRGLSALLGSDEIKPEMPTSLAIDQIEPNTEQPRTRFPEATLDELAQSIIANGIVQPVVVRRKGSRYQIVAGERRWRAAQRAGLRTIPVVVREVADDKLLELALVENIQRQELNPIEEAHAYRKLIESIGLTQEEVAVRVGRERSLIATSLRLLKLPSDILNLIEEGRLSAGHGRALLMIDDASMQRRLARTIVEKGLSVREAERIVKSSGSKQAQKAEKKAVTERKDPNITAAETKLRRKLGTQVIISAAKSGKGRIEIEYYSEQDLDRIYQAIMHKDS